MNVENCLNLPTRDVSSVGSERCFDRAEVIGSSPVRPTSYCSYVHLTDYPEKAPINFFNHIDT